MGCISERELRRLELFESVTSDTIEHLIHSAEIKCYLKGEHVFRDRDTISKVYIVVSGKVAIYKINDRGQKRVVFILDRGKLLNESITQDTLTSVNCEIFEDAQILCCETHLFVQLMQNDFELTKNIINTLSMRIKRMYRQIKNATAIIRVEKRVAAKLWKLGKDYGVVAQNGLMIDMNISITYLADLLGVQRETISRALKILSIEGLIEYKNKKILIKDQDNLSKFFKKL